MNLALVTDTPDFRLPRGSSSTRVYCILTESRATEDAISPVRLDNGL